MAEVSIHYGNFYVSQKWTGLVTPPRFKPPVELPAGSLPQRRICLEDRRKGSDVNLGVHLVRDAFQGAFDHVAVITNDTDLLEPIRIVTEDLGLPLTLLTPCNKPATSLARVSTHVRHVGAYIGPCQLPDIIPVPGKKHIMKPATW